MLRHGEASSGSSSTRGGAVSDAMHSAVEQPYPVLLLLPAADRLVLLVNVSVGAVVPSISLVEVLVEADRSHEALRLFALPKSCILRGRRKWSLSAMIVSPSRMATWNRNPPRWRE